VLFRAIGLPDDLVKARVSIFGSVVDSFVINGQTDQLFGLIGLAPTPIEGKLFQDRDQRRIVGVLATKAFNTVPSTDRIDPEIGKRFNDTQQLKKSDYAHLIKVIKRSLMIIEEYEPRFVVEIFDFDNGGILSLVIEVSKAGTTAATLRSIIDFYEENPDTVVLYQNVADLYRKDFAHLELLYHGGPPPGGFSAIKNKK
jgi:hypothetical protein